LPDWQVFKKLVIIKERMFVLYGGDNFAKGNSFESRKETGQYRAEGKDF